MPKTVVITPSTSDLPPGWSIAQFREVLQRAADAWSSPTVPCGVRVVVGEGRPEWRAARDGTNLVAFRSRSWCHNERCGPTATFPLRAMAMTTPYPGGADLPEEADVELNAVTFRLIGGDGVGSGPSPRWSVPLEPVLIHELGHVLGLPDVCGAERRASGRPVTSACPAEDRERVMFAASLKPRPAPADIAELCRLYPAEGTSTAASTPAAPTPGPSVGAGVELLISLVIVGLALAVGRRVRRALRIVKAVGIRSAPRW